MNQYLNQFANNNFVEAANQIMRKNYELANDLYAKQVQFAQDAAKSSVENFQRFRDAKNAADILNAQSVCWMSSMQAAVSNFQSTVELINRSSAANYDVVSTDVGANISKEKPQQKVAAAPIKKTTAVPKQKASATRKRKPAATRKKTAKKTVTRKA